MYSQGTPSRPDRAYGEGMDNRAEVREFLMTRRAKVTPADAGVPASGTRRVAGLRRSEVATLAGVSVEYYAKLERGSIAGASASVLDALARALQLNDAEYAQLLDLARARTASRPPAGLGAVASDRARFAPACNGRSPPWVTPSPSCGTNVRTSSPSTISVEPSTPR